MKIFILFAMLSACSSKWKPFDDEAIAIWTKQDALAQAGHWFGNPEAQRLTLDFHRQRAKAAAVMLQDRPAIISSDWRITYDRDNYGIRESWTVERVIKLDQAHKSIGVIADIRRGGCGSRTRELFSMKGNPIHAGDARQIFCGKAIAGYVFDAPTGTVSLVHGSTGLMTAPDGLLYDFDDEFHSDPGTKMFHVHVAEAVGRPTMTVSEDHGSRDLPVFPDEGGWQASGTANEPGFTVLRIKFKRERKTATE